MSFIELKSSNDAYSSKLQSDPYEEKELISLAWKVKEINQLDEMGRKCYRDIKEVVEKLDQDLDGCLWQAENIPKQLTSIQLS